MDFREGEGKIDGQEETQERDSYKEAVLRTDPGTMPGDVSRQYCIGGDRRKGRCADKSGQDSGGPCCKRQWHGRTK